MTVAVAGEPGHGSHDEAQGNRPERYSIGAARQAGARRRLAAHPRRLGRAGVTTRNSLALRPPRHQDGSAAVALLVVRVAEAVVPASVRERLGPVRDLDGGSLDAQI